MKVKEILSKISSIEQELENTNDIDITNLKEVLKISRMFIGRLDRNYESNKIISADEFDLLIKATENYYMIPNGSILSKSKISEIIFPKSIIVYLIRSKYKIRIKDIADYFKMHHSSVVHLCQKVNYEINLGYEDTIQNVNELENLLNELNITPR